MSINKLLDFVSAIRNMRVRLVVEFGNRRCTGFTLKCEEGQVIYVLPAWRDPRDVCGVYLDGQEIEYRHDDRTIILADKPTKWQTLLIEYVYRKNIPVGQVPSVSGEVGQGHKKTSSR